jgi:hypothetical protein
LLFPECFRHSGKQAAAVVTIPDVQTAAEWMFSCVSSCRDDHVRLSWSKQVSSALQLQVIYAVKLGMPSLSKIVGFIFIGVFLSKTVC